MFSSMRSYFVVVLAITFFGAPWIWMNHSDKVQAMADLLGNTAWQAAAVILHNPRTITELQAKYASTSFAPDTSSQLVVSTGGTTPTSSTALVDKDDLPTLPRRVRVLLVPGHEPGYGGTEFVDRKFGVIKERAMNTELTSNLFNLLNDDSHFDVSKTRNNEVWNPTFAKYFKDNWGTIIQWQKESHAEMLHLIAIGSTTATAKPKVYHNEVPDDVALRLYGITKWANENDMDVVIHVHFNDYPDHLEGVAGKHSGFAIYVPSGQFGNSTTTKAIAEALFGRLKVYNSVSDLPGESSGIVDESELIAIGANNTADAASMLIEYGYIYEPQFRDPAKRSAALKELAQQTYMGLKDFFEKPTMF